MLTQRHAIELKSGQFSAFFLHMIGVNNAGETLTLANFANLRINRNGQDFVNCDMELLHQYADLKKGLAEFDSTVALAFTVGFEIPASIGRKGEFPNIIQISDDDRCFMHIDFGTTTVDTVVLSGDCQIYGIPASGVEKYLPQLIQDQIVFGGAGSEKKKAAISNLHSILAFPDTAANFAKLQIEKDGQIIQDADYPAIASYTNLNNEKEATALVVAETLLAKGLRHDELFTEDVYIYPTVSGAVTLNLLFVGALFDNKATLNSKARLMQDIQRNKSKKIVAGKMGEIEAIELT